jgi:radical SAM superfamily enzyme YgiQ (UPF0313 family)
MVVTFIDTPSLEGHLGERAAGVATTPNIGLIYMATYLNSVAGADANMIDMAAGKQSPADLARTIKSTRPAIVGFSSKTFNILAVYALAKIVKSVSPGTIVLAGGAHPTAVPEITLKESPDIDAVVMREGELTLLDIYRRVEEGYGLIQEVFAGVPGVVYRDAQGRIIRNPERELIGDLDTLPFPDLSLVDYSRYIKAYNPTRHKFQHLFPVYGSRGCPFKCVFCMPLHTRKHRVRNIDSILEEIELLNRNFGAERIFFEDSLFCSNRKWFEDFCERFREKGLHRKVQWGFETRIDTMHREMFQNARDAGCIYTFFGVESGSEEVLKKSRKGYSRAMVMEKIAAARDAGIDTVNISIILGLPYETKSTVNETLELIKEAPCDKASINILDIYPDTEAFEMADRAEGGAQVARGETPQLGRLFEGVSHGGGKRP